MLIVKCAWCDKVIRVVKTDNDEKNGDAVSHGICKKCADKHFKESKDETK